MLFEKEARTNSEELVKRKVKTLLFVGDIMLDRGVENLIKKNSNFLYPFEKIKDFLNGVDIVIGNLEGPIVEHPPNFGKSLRFAFSPEVISGLVSSNFSLLSLANNHCFDMGKNGLEKTREFLRQGKIDFLGHPLKCEEDSFLEKEDMIFLAFNKTYSFNCSDEEIVETVKKTRDLYPERFLTVIIHWGEEYKIKSSIQQRSLGKKIIDVGADLIIGTHPHVIQEIEEYGGKIIFYSIGNFIFDQFFSEKTQESLAVGLEKYPGKVIYWLFPIKSIKSQPFLMEREEADKFLEKLALRSSASLYNDIKIGIIKRDGGR